jgi:hypothetical protein
MAEPHLGAKDQQAPTSPTTRPAGCSSVPRQAGAGGMTKGRGGVSSRDRLHGSQVSKARPGAPFDCYRRSRLGNCLLTRPPSTVECGPDASQTISRSLRLNEISGSSDLPFGLRIFLPSVGRRAFGWPHEPISRMDSPSESLLVGNL